MNTGSCKSVDFRGANLCCQIYGEGRKALVFIHGWTCNSSLWRLQAPLFQRHCSILIDLPGHGKSDAPNWDYTLDLFAHAVKQVLNQEDIESAVLIGHSLGGPVSTMVLRLFPDSVLAIIYVDSFFNPPEYYFTRLQRKELAEALSDEARFEALVRTITGNRATDEQRGEILGVMKNTAKHVRINVRTTDAQPEPMSVEQVYHIPAVLLVTPRYADVDEEWVHHLPQLETKLWEGYGHFPFLEDATRFNHEVDLFLKKNALCAEVAMSSD
ncbi:uncharacterized protein Z520_05495 [Fonsecaea multimorphosa CBS 102226]|uniref:AB hydrolase-1 domain-containing protein n=1 Tax=Fonsecaea multimorphosa CBS 102226 TaxID=1442371 RepID=A0A0D2K795_9EURO|nr:uncharacterized protein Z520_05495 [Fonsecaea multimorphosa CBS 102226]KIX99034.1 hypothetical protein Z520_05495 [Fonsecaea multimorphosa CBS 102226]OAL25300.1 hypothetical protein AYO22_05177 [Fonsecaea multimorphosa]